MNSKPPKPVRLAFRLLDALVELDTAWEQAGVQHHLPPPELNCGDIPQKSFTVLQPDPHRFDANTDSTGCESST